MEALEALANARRMPSASTTSSVSRRPAVSMNRNRRPSRVRVRLLRCRELCQGCRDDGPVVAEEGVEQGGLASVGAPTMATGMPSSSRCRGNRRERPTREGEVGEQGVEAFAVRELDVLLGKIEFEFKKAGKADQGFAQGVDFAGEAASKLVKGEAVRACVFSGNEVGDGFGLGQVETAIEKARWVNSACLTAPCLNKGPHDLTLDEGRAVNVEFHRVFAGVGAGATEDESESFVEDDSFCVAKATKRDGAVSHGVEWLRKDLGTKVECVRT